MAVSGFTVPPPHHVSPAQPAPLLPALLATKYVFVREDESIPPLAPLYRGPYLVLEQWTKLFRLQLGDMQDGCSFCRQVETCLLYPTYLSSSSASPWTSSSKSSPGSTPAST